MINRIVEAIETRAEERWPGSRHDDRPLPLPWRRRLDPTSRTPSSTFFVRFSSVFERSRAPLQGREDRGGQHPFLLQPPIARCPALSLSLYPFRPAPPSSSSPCLSVSPWLRTANTPGGSTHLRHLTSDQPSQPSIHSAYLPTHLPTYRHLFTRLSLESRIGESAVQPLARHPPPPTTEG